MQALLNLDFDYLLSTYGYLAILVVTFLEGETIVILAGILAASGRLSVPWIAVCAFLGSTSSDQLMFCLGKYKGSSVLSYFPRLEKKKDRVSQLLLKYNTLIILGFRFVYGIRNVTPIMLGICGVPHRRFFILNVIGAICWAVAFTLGGYWFGQAMLKAIEHFGVSLLYIIGALVLLVILVVVIASRRAKKNTLSTTVTVGHSENSDT